MAAPGVPTTPWPGKGWFVDLVNNITIASNLSLPIATDAAQTGVISGTTASLIVAALNAQRDLT